jgi:hypothetical protein
MGQDYPCAPHTPKFRLLSDSPLESSASAYVQYLLDRGSAAGSIRSYLVSAAHFAHWLATHHYALRDLNGPLIKDFLYRHLPACRCAQRLPHVSYCVRPAPLHLVRVLRAGGRISPEFSADPPAIVSELLDDVLIHSKGIRQYLIS